jgi:hypothetical protein
VWLRAILMMVPRETSRGRLYTASAVAWALALFGVEHVSAAQVRRRTSPGPSSAQPRDGVGNPAPGPKDHPEKMAILSSEKKSAR